jgi:hypothetical protein
MPDAMTNRLRQIARSLGLTTAERRDAESALGPAHRLTRALSHAHTLAVQSVTAVLALLACGFAFVAHLHEASLVLVAASVVALAFVVAWFAARRVARDRAQELIADGSDDVALSVVADERRRLSSRKQRERFARSLEELHRDAQRWYSTLPRFQPLHGVLQLRYVSGEVEALVAALRRERVRVQGLALVARFLSDGYASPLYANQLGPLREELNRIRFLLESEPQR